MIPDWKVFIKLRSIHIICFYIDFTFLSLHDNRNALCFPIFGLYFYLCFGFHLLPPQEFYIIAFSFPLLYSQPLSLNPSKWLFSICRSLPLKQNTCLSNYCSISPSNAKLLKNLSVLTISQLILYPF